MFGFSTPQLVLGAAGIVTLLVALFVLPGRNARKKYAAQAAPGGSFPLRSYALLQLLGLSTKRKHEEYRQQLLALLRQQVQHLDYRSNVEDFIAYQVFHYEINSDENFQHCSITVSYPEDWHEARDYHYPGNHAANMQASRLLGEGAPDLQVAEHLLRMHTAGTVVLQTEFVLRLYELFQNKVAN